MKWCKKDNCGHLIFKAVTVFCFCVFMGRGTFYKFDFFAGKSPNEALCINALSLATATEFFPNGKISVFLL